MGEELIGVIGLFIVMSVFWLPVLLSGVIGIIKAWRCVDE